MHGSTYSFRKLTHSPSFLLWGTPISSKVLGPFPGGFAVVLFGGGVAAGLLPSRVLGGMLGELTALFDRTPGLPGKPSFGLPAGKGFRIWGLGLDARLAAGNVCGCGRFDDLDELRSAEGAEAVCVGVGCCCLPPAGSDSCIRRLRSAPDGSGGAENPISTAGGWDRLTSTAGDVVLDGFVSPEPGCLYPCAPGAPGALLYEGMPLPRPPPMLSMFW